MRPNVLLLILDSVRVRNTSIGGYSRDTTPFLEELCRSGTLYTEARAPSEQSITSHASLFTGYHAREHRLTYHPNKTLRPGHTIWEELREDGYRTGVFSSNPFLTHLDVGLTHGFGTVYSGEEAELPFPDGLDPRDYITWGGGEGSDPKPSNDYGRFVIDSVKAGSPARSFLNGVGFLLRGRNLPGVFDRVQANRRDGRVFAEAFDEWLDDGNRPWAACINLMDAHMPYLPRDEHNRWASDEEVALMRSLDHSVWEYLTGSRPWSEVEHLEDLYDGTIRQVDHAVRRIVETLSRRGDFEDTLLVITSDHGEGFGERSEYRSVRSRGHGEFGGLEEPLLHVPLLVRSPHHEEGSRVSDPATLTRFPDVVRSTLDGDPASFVPDEPVLASSPGMSPYTEEGAGQYLDDLSEYSPSGDALYRPTQDGLIKYIRWRGTYTRTELPERETAPLTSEEREWVDEWLSGIEPADAVSATDREITDETMQHLEELGYA